MYNIRLYSILVRNVLHTFVVYILYNKNIITFHLEI